MINRKILLAKTFYTFFANGFMALMLGAIMPYIISDYGISFSTAGLFISLHALGNLAASFLLVFLINIIGRKNAVIFMASLLPLSYLALTVFKNIYLLHIIFFITGLSRGGISNTDNFIVNNVCVGRSDMINLLHTFFAIGGFIAPILCSVFTEGFENWRIVVWIGVFLSAAAVIVYCLIEFNTIDTNKSKSSENKKYYKNNLFFLCAFFLFFYMGVENSINGWVVTYFKESGIMSMSNAQLMLSLTWLLIIIGRLTTGYLSEKKVKKEIMILICSAVGAISCILLLRSTNSESITVFLSVFSFAIAGIYPTTIAAAGKILKSSDAAMALIMAISGAGGIIMPYIVGALADINGIYFGMSFVGINIIIVAAIAFLLMLVQRKNKNKLKNTSVKIKKVND